MKGPLVTHTDIRYFAESHINLSSSLVYKYRTQVNNLRVELERHIKKNPEFGLVKMIHAGSVAKGTALKTINDLDVAVYMRKRHNLVNESKVVPLVENLLCDAYPQKERDDFQSSPRSVRIHFRGSGLDVDVVPVLYYNDKYDFGYLIDKYTGEKLLTNIPCHLQFIRQRKKSNPEHFAQVIRLVKWWAYQRKMEKSTFKCKSFLLELLVAHLVDSGMRLDDYPQALEEFFSYIVKTGLEKRVTFVNDHNTNAFPEYTGDAIEVFDPVNPQNNVTKSYSIFDRNALVETAEDAADAIREAHYATTKERAVKSWQVVLGPTFRGKRP